MIELSLCNELLADEEMTIDRQCEIAAALGYKGLELALGSLVDTPHRMSNSSASDLRQRIESHGLRVTGLHWLLAPYPDLSITDPTQHGRTTEVLVRLIELCGVLGGRVLVHGSPAQRMAQPGYNSQETLAELAGFFAPVARAAERAGVIYCIEPLSRAETDVINTVAEAVKLVELVGSPSFLTMIDTSAAGQSEDEPVADLIRRWVPTGKIAHIQLNDTNRGAPGTGTDPFPDIVRALRETGWPNEVAVEPFRTVIDATTTAAIAAATLRACWEATA